MINKELDKLINAGILKRLYSLTIISQGHLGNDYLQAVDVGLTEMELLTARLNNAMLGSLSEDKVDATVEWLDRVLVD